VGVAVAIAIAAVVVIQAGGPFLLVFKWQKKAEAEINSGKKQ